MTAGADLIEVGDGERLVVVVVNPASSGDSQKPGLCIGDADEVASCKATLGTGGGEGGGSAQSSTISSATTTTASGADSSGAQGAGGAQETDGGEDDDAASDADEGCGCSVIGDRDRPAPGWLGAIGLTFCMSVRRSLRRWPSQRAGIRIDP